MKNPFKAYNIQLEKTKGSLLLINKENPLPKDYRPYDMRTPHVAFVKNDNFEKTLLRQKAAIAIEKMFKAALREDIELYGVSFFRPYFRQSCLYRECVLAKGEDYASTHMAKPGYSEHQSGLCADITCETVNFQLKTSFATSPEGLWVDNNAHKYGFIIRYPLGKEMHTGYSFEPWHIRYVGNYVARDIYRGKLSLEEWHKKNAAYFPK